MSFKTVQPGDPPWLKDALLAACTVTLLGRAGVAESLLLHRKDNDRHMFPI